MEINLWVVLALLALHFIADFVLQTNAMATNKWKDPDALLTHVFVYTLCFFLFTGVVSIITGEALIWLYPFLVGILHYFTDKYTSRWTHRLWEEKKVHNFFVVIGFDQLLHFIQILLLFKLLS